MRLWLPGDPGISSDYAAIRARVIVAMPGNGAPREGFGIALRLRFIHELPQEALAVRPPLPSSPPLPTLLWVWGHALAGTVYEDAAQIAQVYARREWGHAAGVEVSL